MKCVEILFYPSDLCDCNGFPGPDLDKAKPQRVVSSMKFQLHYCLEDFAFQVARCFPGLGDRELPIDVVWEERGPVMVPVLSLHVDDNELKLAYPTSALRGAEVLDRADLAPNLEKIAYIVRPTTDTTTSFETASDFDLESVEASQDWADDFVVRIPSIPEGATVKMPPLFVGGDYQQATDMPVVIAWKGLRRWVKKVGSGLRRGNTFVEDALLGAGSVFRTPEGTVVHVVEDLERARHTEATAISIKLTPETYRAHDLHMRRLNFGREERLLSRTLWVHTHDIRAITMALTRGGPENGEPTSEAENPKAQTSLFFSKADLETHKRGYPPWGIAVVLDAVVAEALKDPRPEDAANLFAVYGWSQGRIVRRAAHINTGN